jgi:hypothetical protein
MIYDGLTGMSKKYSALLNSYNTYIITSASALAQKYRNEFCQKLALINQKIFYFYYKK